jgi:hypothetical protein
MVFLKLDKRGTITAFRVAVLLHGQGEEPLERLIFRNERKVE